ncbi:MAG: DUF2007 domain-containing protein [Clostridia bacterium]|nr:DUF2007 domain-containing protein [Clostridia bacterium]
MITLFNRRELITTFSMDAQAKFRSILSQNGIDYRIKTKSNSSVSYARGRTGTYGQNPGLACQYTIYVHRNDYEKAQYLISK